MKKLSVLFALLLIAGTCTAQPMMSWFTKAHGDTLGTLTLNGKPNAWFSATKGWQYVTPKATLSSGSLEEKIITLSAKVDSLEKKLTRTRRDLAKETKKTEDLKNKYLKGATP